jgi:hypothetical protein
MYKLSKNHLELFKLATNLDKSKKFDLSDHIYELMTRISQTEEPPINLSLGGDDPSNDPKTALDYFIGIAYDVVVNRKKSKSSALQLMNHYRERQNKEVLNNEEKISPDSEFWTNVNSVLETKDWWQDAEDKPEEKFNPSTSSSGFKNAVQIVLGLEGGFSEYNPSTKDPRTNKGITQPEFDEFRRKNNLQSKDVKDITTDEAIEIYKQEYWDKIQGDKLDARNPKLAIVIFDSAVNNGIGGANGIIKSIVNTNGNRFDDKMIEDIIAADKSNDLYSNIINKRYQKYKDIIAKNPVMDEYGKGWNNRLDNLSDKLNRL